MPLSLALSPDARRFAKIPFFATLEPRALERLAFLSEARIVRRGEILFRRGDMGDWALMLLSGQITLDPEKGTQPLVVAPGNLIGEMALLVETERRTTAHVHEPSAVLRISRDMFLKILRDNPASAISLRAYCARRLRAFTGELDSASRALSTATPEAAD